MSEADLPDQSATRAIAIVGMLLNQGLISVLTRKGILTADQTNDLFEIVLRNLETYDPSDLDVTKARVLLDGIATITAKHFPRQA